VIRAEDVERARERVRRELRDAGLPLVPEDERALRSALPLYRVAASPRERRAAA